MRKKKEQVLEPEKSLIEVVKEPPSIGEVAIRFVTSPDISAFERAIVVGKLKKLIDKIEDLDGYMQEQALADFFYQYSTGNNCLIPNEPFLIVRRQIKKTRYSDEAKAKAILNEIDKLRYRLKKLEVVDEIGETFYLKYKEETNGKEQTDSKN
jgi:hypothetical protein